MIHYIIAGKKKLFRGLAALMKFTLFPRLEKWHII